MSPRIIAHVDLDAFFAAVEQRDNPTLQGKPVVIGADPKQGKGRGVVSTCSYEARVYGIHSAMPISIAYKKCPQAVFLRGNYSKYQQASEEVFKIFEQFTPHIEPISIDEAFLDLTGSCHLFGTPYQTAQKLKDQVKIKVGLTASVGIAPVKMVAKIASDYCKPDGLLEIKEAKIFDFLWPLPIERLWGVGPKTKQTLNALGIKTIGDLAQGSLKTLKEYFGEEGQHLFNLANGIDLREVSGDEDVKSVSHEHTFEADTSNLEEIDKVFLILSEKVSRRLRKYELKGRTLTVKIRLKGFKTYTRAYTFAERTNHLDIIYTKAKELFKKFYKPGYEIRLIGVRISNFDDFYVRDSLFEDEQVKRSEHVHTAVDKIKDKFGEQAIRRAI